MTHRFRMSLSALTLLSSFVFSMAGQAAPTRTVRHTSEHFGTQVQVIAVANGDAGAQAISAACLSAFAEMARVEAMVDPTKPGSPIAKINAQAGIGPVTVEPEVFSLLERAQRISVASEGAFDLTFAALSSVWTFKPSDPKQSLQPPSPESVQAVLPKVGHRNLVLDPAARSVFLNTKGMQIALGAVAKGYALARAQQKLVEAGVSDFILSAGGDLVVRGQKPDGPWMVGVQDPRGEPHFAALPTKDNAVMTSGDYERYFIHGGKRYGHILDPRTGQSASQSRSATVIGPDSVLADMLSTAAFVLGAEKGMALVKSYPGYRLLLVDAQNKVHASEELKANAKLREPSDGI